MQNWVEVLGTLEYCNFPAKVQYSLLEHCFFSAGLERLVATVQGKTSNYDTDTFTPIFAAIEQGVGEGTYLD